MLSYIGVFIHCGLGLPSIGIAEDNVSFKANYNISFHNNLFFKSTVNPSNNKYSHSIVWLGLSLKS